jgi:hypothetical protein
MQKATVLRYAAVSALFLAFALSCSAAEKPKLNMPEAEPTGESASSEAPESEAAAEGTPHIDDPRALADPDLTYEEQSAADQKWRREQQFAWVDSLDLNEQAIIALHATPRAERRTFAEVAEAARECDNLITAVPPGEWDVFVILAGFDQLKGVSLSFNAPEDWSFDGFSLNSELGGPYSWGNIRESEFPPYMVAFNCVVHPGLEDGTFPKGAVPPARGDLVVLGRLELIAPSPGTLSIADHPEPPGPEVMNCWLRTRGVMTAARGRFDVGKGAGARPCDSGKPLATNLTSPDEAAP